MTDREIRRKWRENAHENRNIKSTYYTVTVNHTLPSEREFHLVKCLSPCNLVNLNFPEMFPEYEIRGVSRKMEREFSKCGYEF